jgi:hypothetical protein
MTERQPAPLLTLILAEFPNDGLHYFRFEEKGILRVCRYPPMQVCPTNRVPRAITRFSLHPDLIACTPPSAPTDDQRHLR